LKTILISNRKGGVGKSTTAVNLSAYFSKNGYKVLLIDLDTQSHLQFGLGLKKKFKRGMHKLFLDGDVQGVVQKTDFENLYFIPANINFDTSKLDPSTDTLKNILDMIKIMYEYDICIIDTPPTSDVLLNNALYASDYVIVPMQTEYLGYIGVMQFLKLFYDTASKINANFNLLGVLPTLYVKSIKEHHEIIDKLKDKIGKKRVFEPIRKDFKLSQSFSAGKPVCHFDERCRGAKDYEKLYESVKKSIFKG